MVPTRAVIASLTIGFLFLSSAASAQQAQTAQPTTRPAGQAEAQRPDAGAAVQASAENLTRLQAAADRLEAKLKADYQNGPEWKGAIEAVKRTAKDHDAARKAAVARLQRNPEYARAAANYQKARQAYDALANRPGNEAARSELADQVQAVRAAVAKQETAAQSADAEVQRAKQAVQKAQADLTELKRRLPNLHESNPDWLALQQQIDAMRDTLAEARRAQVQQAYALQARAEQETRDRLREETLVRMQQQIVEQQIILYWQQQALAAQQAQWVPQPQMTTLGQSAIRGPAYYFQYDRCLPHRSSPRYRSDGSAWPMNMR